MRRRRLERHRLGSALFVVERCSSDGALGRVSKVLVHSWVSRPSWRTTIAGRGGAAFRARVHAPYNSAPSLVSTQTQRPSTCAPPSRRGRSAITPSPTYTMPAPRPEAEAPVGPRASVSF